MDLQSQTTGITQPLDEINQLVKSEPSLSVKAFGILLLGKEFTLKIMDEKKELDPTETILMDMMISTTRQFGQDVPVA